MALSRFMARARAALYHIVIVGLICAPMSASAQAERDHARDFAWEIGTWSTHVRVRAPLSTEESWTDFRGTSVVHAFSNGRANLVDLSVASGERRIEGVALRLYNPTTGQWNINYAGMRDGALTPPVYGAFTDGRGVFYGQDSVDGRAVLVRFVISDVTADSARFVQSYSADGGQTWIDNWIAVDTRRR